MKDYYAILKVSDQADPEEIGKAYRTIALKLHPDKGKETTSEMFMEATEAYDVLKDKKKREDYDQRRIKKSVIKPARIRQGSDVQVEVKIKAEDIANEITKSIITTRQGPCPVCSGTGAKNKKLVPCRDCNKSGIDAVSVIMGQKTYCQSCRGYGDVSNMDCPECRGSGIKRENITRKITLSRDFQPTIVIPQSGNYFPGGSFGNLHICFQVERSSPYSVEGKNIKGHLKISPAQAILGDILFIDVMGNVSKIIITPGTLHGDIIENKNEGVTKSGKKGSLFIKIIVDTKKKITGEETCLYNQLLKIQKKIPQ